MSADKMFGYFNTNFGFSPSQVITIFLITITFNEDIFLQCQVVALMGAHSIGGAFLFNSGYSGKWTGIQNRGFSEIYYKNMINPSLSWTNVVCVKPNCNHTYTQKCDING